MNKYIAHFSIIEDNDKFTVLQDLDGPKSITNDAEAVYQRIISPSHFKRLFYFDSYGDAAEMVSYGVDVRLIPLPYKTVDEIKEFVVFGVLS